MLAIALLTGRKAKLKEYISDSSPQYILEYYDMIKGMINFKTDSLDMMVTPNHKMMTYDRDGNWVKKRADEVVVGDQFLTTAVWEGDDAKVYLSKMNMGLMARMFGGNIAKVMGTSVARDEKMMLAGIVRD